MASADPERWESRAIELAGRRCRIFVDDPAWLAHLDRTCGRYREDPAAAGPVANLYLVSRTERLPVEPRQLLASAEIEAGPARSGVGQVGGKTVVVEARKLLVVTADLGVCLVRRPVSSIASFYYNYLHPLLVEWLARSGVLYVHAGAIEQGKSGSVLIAGPRHAGKTTTCLASLAAAECRFLSDDMVLIDEQGRLHTLLQPMHPERRLCEAWSSHLGRAGIAIGRLEPLEGGRLELAPDRWFGDRVVDRLDRPRALILPWADGASTTCCQSVGPEQAAAVLLAQVHAGVPPLDRALLARICDLLALPTLRLHVGRAGFADPGLLWRELSRSLEGTI